MSDKKKMPYQKMKAKSYIYFLYTQCFGSLELKLDLHIPIVISFDTLVQAQLFKQTFSKVFSTMLFVIVCWKYIRVWHPPQKCREEHDCCCDCSCCYFSYNEETDKYYSRGELAHLGTSVFLIPRNHSYLDIFDKKKDFSYLFRHKGKHTHSNKTICLEIDKKIILSYGPSNNIEKNFKKKVYFYFKSLQVPCNRKFDENILKIVWEISRSNHTLSDNSVCVVLLYL